MDLSNRINAPHGSVENDSSDFIFMSCGTLSQDKESIGETEGRSDTLQSRTHNLARVSLLHKSVGKSPSTCNSSNMESENVSHGEEFFDEEKQFKEISQIPYKALEDPEKKNVGYDFSYVKDILRLLGPGWLIAMAYIDPGNLEGDLVAGAVRDPLDPQAGYRLLWVLLLATCVACVFQHLAVRLGVFSGRDLASICREHFPRWFIWIFWLNIEISLIGADIQSVIGSAIGLKLLFDIPYKFGSIITLTDSAFLLILDVWGSEYLEATFAFFISIMSVCFYINMYTSKPNLHYILNGLTCISIPPKSLALAISLVGSVVMPHNFFLQSAVVQSRSFNRQAPSVLNYVVNVYTTESIVLLLISLSVNIAVIVAFASPALLTSHTLNLSNAHIALQSALGKHSAWVWAVGLLASGQCATVASTYAGQFLMEGFLGLRFKNLATRLLVTRLSSLIPLFFLLTSNTVTVEIIANTINILQAVHLPFILVLLIRLTSCPDLIGPQCVISRKLKFICYISSVVLIGANIVLSVTQLAEISWLLVYCFLFVYFISIIYVWFYPFKSH